MVIKFQSKDKSIDDLSVDVTRVHIVAAAFGYESRALEFTDAYLKKCPRPVFAVANFSDLKEGEGRAKNDKFLAEQNINAINISSQQYEDFKGYVDEILSQSRTDKNKSITVYLDYSCMPRSWYCNLSVYLLKTLLPGDALQLWYTPGKYNKKAFSPSGIDDFDVFSGQASLSPVSRTHILGLGFESVRAQAILAVVDPEYLVCFYADPGVGEEYVERVINENSDLLNAAHHRIKLPLASFETAFTRLRGVTQEFRSSGDVILIPDGPKPLVLAASLVPLTVAQPGVTCLHVRRRSRKPEAALDVTPAAVPFGAELIVGGT